MCIQAPATFTGNKVNHSVRTSLCPRGRLSEAEDVERTNVTTANMAANGVERTKDVTHTWRQKDRRRYTDISCQDITLSCPEWDNTEELTRTNKLRQPQTLCLVGQEVRSDHVTSAGGKSEQTGIRSELVPDWQTTVHGKTPSPLLANDSPMEAPRVTWSQSHRQVSLLHVDSCQNVAADARLFVVSTVD